MNTVREAIKQAKSLGPDERQEQVRQHSSYVAMSVMLVAYLAIAFVYTVRNALVPISTQLIFILAAVVFAFLTLRGEGARFRIPLMMETKTSLRQPSAVRALCWFIMFSSLVLYPVSGIAGSIQEYLYWKPAPTLQFEVVITIVGFFLSVALSYWMARWIREGRVVFMALFGLGCVSAIWGCLVDSAISYLPADVLAKMPHSVVVAAGTPVLSPSLAPMELLFGIWSLYVLLRYWRRIVQDGRAYQEETGIAREGTFFNLVTAKTTPVYWLRLSIGSYAIYNLLNDTVGQHAHWVVALIAYANFMGGIFLVVSLISLILNRRTATAAQWWVFVGIGVMNSILANFAK